MFNQTKNKKEIELIKNKNKRMLLSRNNYFLNYLFYNVKKKKNKYNYLIKALIKNTKPTKVTSICFFTGKFKKIIKPCIGSRHIVHRNINNGVESDYVKHLK